MACNADQARKLDNRIRLTARATAGSVTTLTVLLDEARCGQIHQVLGFASWTAYLADALCDLRLAVTAVERRELVSVMADEGMSNRAIAKAVGVTEITVRRDREQVRHDVAPESPGDVLTPLADGAEAVAVAVIEASRKPLTPPVIGLDGKTYTRPEPKPPSPRRRRPITEAFSELRYRIGKLAESMERLSEDDRFARNVDGLRHEQSDLIRARDAINRVLDKLDAAVAE